jgi:toluene monooxygenase system protein B
VSGVPVRTDISLQALFDGDFLSFLVDVEPTETIDEACDKVAFGVVNRRIPAREGVGYVMRDESGTVIPGHLTVAEAGLQTSDYITVAFQS